MATVYSLICFGGRYGKTVTFTDAGDVVNLTNNGLRVGTGVAFSTTGTLPTGLTAGTTYYAKPGADANKFLIYPTSADAIAGTNQVTFTGTGTGTHTVKSAYFLGLTTEQLARYGSAGSERIYDGIAAFVSGRADASAFDTEICEIGEVFTNILSGGLLLTLPSAIAKIYPLPGIGHEGTIGAGFSVEMANANTSVAMVRVQNCELYGITIFCNGVGSGVSAESPGSIVDRCIIYSNGSGTANFGTKLQSSVATLTNCRVYGFKYGYRNLHPNLQKAIVANNTFTKNDIGVSSAFTTNVWEFFWNNISCGNTTTDWATAPTGIKAGGNAGVSPWVTGSYSSVTMATTDFANYAGNDFRPALSTSPQVDSGISYYGVSTLDISGGERPNYNNGGAEAVDIGADEFDHGYGPHPNVKTVTISAANSVSLAGAEIRVYDLDNSPAGSLGTELSGVESNGGSTYSYAGQAGNSVWIQIMLPGYVEFGQQYTIPSFDSALTVTLLAEGNA